MGCCQSDLEDATYSNTQCEIYDFTRAKVIKVYDGDTFWIAGKHNGVVMKFKMRLFGCDCPELKTEKGKQVRDYVCNLIQDKIITVQILSNKIYNGKKISEKYGRLLGFVWIDKINLTNHLIEKQFAVPYFGGTKSTSP